MNAGKTVPQPLYRLRECRDGAERKKRMGGEIGFAAKKRTLLAEALREISKSS